MALDAEDEDMTAYSGFSEVIEDDEDEEEPESQASDTSESTTSDASASRPASAGSTSGDSGGGTSSRSSVESAGEQSFPLESMMGRPRSASPQVVDELRSRPIPNVADQTNPAPYVVRRKNIEDGRTNTLRVSTHEATGEMERVVMEHLKEDVFPGSKINERDVREMALIIGFQHLDEMVDGLYEWGFSYISDDE